LHHFRNCCQKNNEYEEFSQRVMPEQDKSISLSCIKVHADQEIDQKMQQMVQANMKVDGSNFDSIELPWEGEKCCDKNSEIADPE
jgi:hypothetical protein